METEDSFSVFSCMWFEIPLSQFIDVVNVLYVLGQYQGVEISRHALPCRMYACVICYGMNICESSCQTNYDMPIQLIHGH